MCVGVVRLCVEGEGGERRGGSQVVCVWEGEVVKLCVWLCVWVGEGRG